MRYQIRLFFFNIGVIDSIFKQNEMKKIKIKNRKKKASKHNEQTKSDYFTNTAIGAPGGLGFFAKFVDSLF